MHTIKQNVILEHILKIFYFIFFCVKGSHNNTAVHTEVIFPATEIITKSRCKMLGPFTTLYRTSYVNRVVITFLYPCIWH